MASRPGFHRVSHGVWPRSRWCRRATSRIAPARTGARSTRGTRRSGSGPHHQSLSRYHSTGALEALGEASPRLPTELPADPRARERVAAVVAGAIATSAADDAARPATKDEARASPAQATDAAHHTVIAADARRCRSSSVEPVMLGISDHPARPLLRAKAQEAGWVGHTVMRAHAPRDHHLRGLRRGPGADAACRVRARPTGPTAPSTSASGSCSRLASVPCTRSWLPEAERRFRQGHAIAYESAERECPLPMEGGARSVSVGNPPWTRHESGADAAAA
jgi:hypothetical protein